MNTDFGFTSSHQFQYP